MCIVGIQPRVSSNRLVLRFIYNAKTDPVPEEECVLCVINPAGRISRLISLKYDVRPLFSLPYCCMYLIALWWWFCRNLKVAADISVGDVAVSDDHCRADGTVFDIPLSE